MIQRSSLGSIEYGSKDKSSDIRVASMTDENHPTRIRRLSAATGTTVIPHTYLQDGRGDAPENQLHQSVRS